MSVKFYKNDNRVIKIEPNPFKKLKTKFKMRVKRMQGGKPVVNSSGAVQYKDEEPKNLTRVPGTGKKLCHARIPGGVNSGLDIMVTNPYKDEDFFTVEWAERVLKDKPKVLLQYLLEYECGFEHNYLTSRIPEGAQASDKQNRKFFEKPESKPGLNGNVTILNMSNIIDRINYYTILAHKEVANTFTEIDPATGDNFDAWWYIVDSDEKDKHELTKIEKETKAAAALEGLRESNSEAIQQMARALDIEEASDRNLTKAKAATLVYNYYNQNMDCYDNFMDYYAEWKDAARRDRFIAASEVFNYVKSGVISYRNGKYTWIKKGEEGRPSETFMRKSKTDLINNFLLDPSYQEEVDLLQEEYEEKIR